LKQSVPVSHAFDSPQQLVLAQVEQAAGMSWLGSEPQSPIDDEEDVGLPLTVVVVDMCVPMPPPEPPPEPPEPLSPQAAPPTIPAPMRRPTAAHAQDFM